MSQQHQDRKKSDSNYSGIQTNPTADQKRKLSEIQPVLRNLIMNMLALLFNVQPQELYPDLFKELEVFVVEQKRKLVEGKQSEAGLVARRAEIFLTMD